MGVRFERKADVLTADLEQDVFNKMAKPAWGSYTKKASSIKYFTAISFHFAQHTGLLSQSRSFPTVYAQMGNSRLQVFQKRLHFDL